jgi:hypothetical protein
MTTLFNFRSNPKNRCGTSNKIWRISRRGRSVKRTWGPGVMKHRRPVLAGHGHRPLVTTLKSEQLAKNFLRTLVARKIEEGYDKLRRARSRSLKRGRKR